MGLIKDIRDIQPNNPFNITKEDLIGDLKDFPLGVVVKMLEEQEKQGNMPNIKIFQKLRYEDYYNGGFNWDKSEDGYDFWLTVIKDGEYNRFYIRYPEYKKYDYQLWDL